MFTKQFKFALLIISIAIVTSASIAADWPQFHGPNRENISTETGLLKSWPENGPKLLWTTENLGHGFSSISVVDGIIYTAGNIEKDTVVTALDLDGKVLWRAKNGPAWTKDYPGTRSTPTVDGDRIYHQSPLGNIVCLNAKTGKTIWHQDILTKVNSKNNKWALAESLLIDGDHVISSPGGPEASMLALDKNTGSIVWKAPATNELAGYASPLLVEYKGLRIIFTLTAKSLIAVNTDTGALLAHIKHESYADENVLIPIYRDGHIFISTLFTGSVKWKMNVAGPVLTLDEVWRTKDMDNHHGGVILLGDNLYGTSTVKNSNQWICLDWITGEKKSTHKGVGKGSLTYSDGMFYTLSIDRKMGLVQPTSTGLELISSFEIPKGGKGKSWAHPVVSNGRLYIRHGDYLYAYKIK